MLNHECTWANSAAVSRARLGILNSLSKETSFFRYASRLMVDFMFSSSGPRYLTESYLEASLLLKSVCNPQPPDGIGRHTHEISRQAQISLFLFRWVTLRFTRWRRMSKCRMRIQQSIQIPILNTFHRTLPYRRVRQSLLPRSTDFSVARLGPLLQIQDPVSRI